MSHSMISEPLNKPCGVAGLVQRFLRIGMGATLALAIAACATTPAGYSSNAPVVISGAGDITAMVERYRSVLGGADNGGTPGTQASGFRSLNWDKMPDEFATPHNLPADFFNAPTAPRARGVVLTTPGTGLQVSARPGNPANIAPRFGNINSQYPRIFKSFSPERLFTPVGSNVVEMAFFVPGSRTPAVVRGLGGVFANVRDPQTIIELFDAAGNSLGKFPVPVAKEGLSFVGVAFAEPIVAHVRIEHGNAALGPDDGGNVNVAVMDDYIYGEPHAMTKAVLKQSGYGGYSRGYGNSDGVHAWVGGLNSPHV